MKEMRRIILVLTVALVMAAMLVASALPAFAAAGFNANCVGKTATTLNQEGKAEGDAGRGGQTIGFLSQELGATGEVASTNSCPPA